MCGKGNIGAGACVFRVGGGMNPLSNISATKWAMRSAEFTPLNVFRAASREILAIPNMARCFRAQVLAVSDSICEICRQLAKRLPRRIPAFFGTTCLTAIRYGFHPMDTCMRSIGSVLDISPINRRLGSSSGKISIPLRFVTTGS